MISMIPAPDWFAVYADVDGAIWTEPLVCWYAIDSLGPIPLVVTMDGTAGQVGPSCIAILHREQLPLEARARKYEASEIWDAHAARVKRREELREP